MSRAVASDWLAPLRAALDQSSAEVAFFLRDDDAGWEDERLLALAKTVARFGLPLDLAVIPAALAPALARTLCKLHHDWRGALGLHQHGFAHVDHEPNGRKSEFGPSRSRAAQQRDLSEGRRILESQLGGCLQPVFTPPWNRCTALTAELLPQVGICILSDHVGGQRFAQGGLAEVPVSVDWSYGKREGARLTPVELSELAADQVRAGDPVGINLHHAVMDDEELRRLGELCELLAEHPRACCLPLVEVAQRTA